MSITVTCRSPEELQEALFRFKQTFPEGVKRALWLYARLVMNDAQAQVPVQCGLLILEAGAQEFAEELMVLVPP